MAKMIAVDWRPAPRQLRLFAGLLLLFSAGLAAYLHWRAGVSAGVAGAVAGAGGGLGLLGLALPRAIWPVYVALMAVSLPIGFVVSHVILAVVYFGVLTPIGLALRLAGKDPLDRRIDRDAPTYWAPRRPVSDVRRYFRQF